MRSLHSLKGSVGMTVYATLSFFFLASALPAHADSKQIFSVSPILFSIPLIPGKSTTQEITVTNLTTKPLPLQTNLQDFESTGEEGGYVFEDTHTNPLLQWIKLSNTQLLLKPKEKKKLQVTITTPRTIPLGGYSGMLFFEPVTSTVTSHTTTVIAKVGVLMLASIGVPDPKAKPLEIVTFAPGFPDGNQLPLLLRVKNTSLHFITAKPQLSFSPVFSLTKSDPEIRPLEEKLIFQGKIRRWGGVIDLSDLPPNLYKTNVAVSFGNGNFVTKETYVLIFPIMQTIIGTSLIVFFRVLIAKRKRLKKALSVFFS